MIEFKFDNQFHYKLSILIVLRVAYETAPQLITLPKLASLQQLPCSSFPFA